MRADRGGGGRIQCAKSLISLRRRKHILLISTDDKLIPELYKNLNCSADVGRLALEGDEKLTLSPEATVCDFPVACNFFDGCACCTSRGGKRTGC